MREKISTILFFLYVVGIVLCVFSFTASADAINDTSFSTSEVTDQSLCRYVTKNESGGHDVRVPLFANVKDIYISTAERYIQRLKDPVKEKKLLNPSVVSQLMVCVHEKNYPSIPVHVLEGNFTSLLGGVYQNSGAMVIRVGVEAITGQSFKGDLFDNEIILISFLFIRNGDYDAWSEHCERAFPYTENEEIFLNLLTQSIQSCSMQNYYLIGGAK